QGFGAAAMTLTVTELAEEVRESNKRLTEARHDLRADFADFRVEVAKELGAINANLEKHRAETAASLRFAGRSVVILIPVVVALIGAAFWITWYAAKLDSRVGQVESRLDKGGPVAPGRQAGLIEPIPWPHPSPLRPKKNPFTIK